MFNFNKLLCFIVVISLVILYCQTQAMEHIENNHVLPMVHKSNAGKLMAVLFKKDHNINFGCPGIQCECPDKTCNVKCCTG